MKNGRYTIVFERGGDPLGHISPIGRNPLSFRIREEGKPHERYLSVLVRVHEHTEKSREIQITGSLIINEVERGSVTIIYKLDSKTGTFLFAE